MTQRNRRLVSEIGTSEGKQKRAQFVDPRPSLEVSAAARRSGVNFVFRPQACYDSTKALPKIFCGKSNLHCNDHFGGKTTGGNANLPIKFTQIHINYVHLMFKFHRADGCCIAQRPHASVGPGFPGGSRLVKINMRGRRAGRWQTHGVTYDESKTRPRQ